MAGQALRIVLIGKVGVGKSATGNTLLGKKVFTSAPSANGVTERCKKGSAVNEGRYIDVIDTPGVLDPDRDPEDLKQEILRCMRVSRPGPHAFLLVMSVGRFAKAEQNAVKALQEIFGMRAADYMIVLFTRGDDLEGQTIEDYVCNARPQLRAVVKSCGGRLHVFNNKTSSLSQVRLLMGKIDEMVAVNGGDHFSEAMYKEVDQVVSRRGDSDDLDRYQFSFLVNLFERVIRFQKILDE